MKKIMIVDDAQFMQKITSAMLQPKYETVCVSSGEEALEAYEREKPDLILTDLIMRGMTGLELQQKLQEQYRENIHIMFMTADEREENENLSLAGGAMDYIRKPFKQELLLRRVDNIMRHLDRMEKLRAVADADPLTRLYNKAYTEKILTDICSKASGILMMVDLDDFKLVNDLYGHDMGDKVLVRFADILRSLIRGSDVAGRVGGDEFILFCQDISEEEVVAEKTRQMNEQLLNMARDLMGEDMNIPLGVSVGAVLVPEMGTEFTDLYKKSDTALYRVKQRKKHGYVFYGGSSHASTESVSGAGSPGSLDGVRMILEERNRPKGAYALDPEGFKCVYRFLIRTIENYHRTVQLLLFTLSERSEHKSESFAVAVDRFGEVLGESLRRSDAYTRSGRRQYTVLLSEIDEDCSMAPIIRIKERWSMCQESRGAVLNYETQTLKP